MSKNSIFLLVGSIVGTIILWSTLFLYLFLYGIAYLIYNYRDCDRFIIDHVELQTGIDIPPVISSNCNYDEGNGIKTAVFHIDGSGDSFEKKLIERYGMKKSRLNMNKTSLPFP